MRSSKSDIDLPTLAIAAAASAVAAYLTSLVWPGGTLLSAALTPIIVALVKEALARPVDRVAATLRTPDRRAGEPPAPAPDDAGPAYSEVAVYGRPNRRWIRVGLVSGLAAFALVVAVVTLPELIAGQSIGGGGGDRATTFFGGRDRAASKDAKRKRDRDKPAAGATDTPTPTPTPTRTATRTPAPTTAPQRTATPSPAPAATATASPLPAPAPGASTTPVP